MARYVIDARVLLLIADGEVGVDPSHQLVAPKSIHSAALQILLDEVRAGTRSERDAREAHVRITEQRMRLLGDRRSRGQAWRLAREHDWDSLGPAEYLAICQLQGDALVALDPALNALAEGVVPVARVDALAEPAEG